MKEEQLSSLLLFHELLSSAEKCLSPEKRADACRLCTTLVCERISNHQGALKVHCIVMSQIQYHTWQQMCHPGRENTRCITSVLFFLFFRNRFSCMPNNI